MKEVKQKVESAAMVVKVRKLISPTILLDVLTIHGPEMVVNFQNNLMQE
jgi:hypothetical protein